MLLSGNPCWTRCGRAGPASFAALFPRGELPAARHAGQRRIRPAGRAASMTGTGRAAGDAPFVLLQHTISGSGRLRYEKRVMEVRPGQTMLLKFPHDNRYWLPHGRELGVLLAVPERAGGDAPLAGSARPARAAGPPVGRPRSSSSPGCACAALRQEARSPARGLGPRLYGVDGGCRGAAALGRGADPGGPGRPRSNARSRSARPSWSSSSTWPAWRRAAGYSRHHFSRLFTAHQGVSPARYLTRLRMEEAARLLRSDPAPIKVIAGRSGFADPNYFGKVFRRYFGIGPRDFRRSGMYAETGKRPAAGRP